MEEVNPHGSWHRDGRLHHKSFNMRMSPAEVRQEPNSELKGTHNLVTRGIALDEPRAFGVTCDPTKFSDVMEIPVGILSPKRYETYTSIDVTEPGMQPRLMGGSEKLLKQRVFDDAMPHIAVTVYMWATRTESVRAVFDELTVPNLKRWLRSNLFFLACGRYTRNHPLDL